jgi:acyl-CoA thioesterase FadM
MNLWIRFLWLLIATAWRPTLDPRTATSRLMFRVLPNDLDINMHMNNGRYLTIMDLGRIDLVLRSGLGRAIWKNNWAPTLGAVVIRYRQELRPFERYRLETRLSAWSESVAVMEATFVVASGPRRGRVAARALVKAGFYDRKKRTQIPVRRLVAELGLTGAESASPPLTPEIEAFLAADSALRRQLPARDKSDVQV